MSLIVIPYATSEVNKPSYSPEYLRWKGYYDQVPLLRSTLNAVGDSVAASWATLGKQGDGLRTILNNFDGNGKETFKILMRNAVVTGMICGDAFFEVVTNKDLGVENMVMLPSNNIRIIIKNGRIKKYEEITCPVGEKPEKWEPEEIFHYVNNPMGATVHGTSDIEPLQNLLIYLKQVQTDYADIMHNYAVPEKVYEVDTSDPTEMANWKSDIMALKNRGLKVLIVPKDSLKTTITAAGIDLDPVTWHRTIIEQILASMRVPDLALGTGTVNSEESARMKYSGFRQLVRMKQQLLEEQLQRQLFPQIYPEDTPSIEFSFAAEPQEERFNRMMNAITVIAGIDFDPRFKSELILDLMQKGGVLPNE